MDGRNIVSFNRFFSAQEIVKSNEGEYFVIIL